jgi:pSer/pThr/pTyr-binding forkhead associated (FHA) protein
MPNGGTTLFVGRDPQACQVVFPAGMDHVSAVHACFIWNPVDGSLALRDLSSSGTWVNGQRIDGGSTVALASGDVVELGGPDINRFTVEITALEAL